MGSADAHSETPRVPHSDAPTRKHIRSPMRPSLHTTRRSPRPSRRTLPLLGAALLAAAIAAPVAAVAPGGASLETVSGVLEAIQVEGRDGSDPVIWSVRDGHRVTPVHFDN